MVEERTVAIVTGGAGGIGGGIARRLARAGFAVGILDRDLAGAESACAAVRELGVESAAADADITDDAQVQRAFVQLRERLGPPRVLVNNAGWDSFARFRDSTAELWDRVIAINFRGLLSCTHAALADVCAAGERGRVISIASDAGRVGSSGEAVYSGCKAAIIGFSKALAREVARHGIHVNVVCPGPTNTPLLAEVGADNPNLVQALAKAVPWKRIGEPEDISGAVAFLLSDDAAFITGQTISVSGGMSMV